MKNYKLSDDEILKKVKFALLDWAYGDLHRASNGGAKMGAFILASCYIDYLAWFYSDKKGIGLRYKEFSVNFLKMYNSDDLYTSLRCKLVHHYSEGGKYEFTHNKPHFHLKSSVLPGRTIINLDNFLIELKNASDDYFALVDSNKTCKKRLVEKYKSHGILGPSPIDSLK